MGLVLTEKIVCFILVSCVLLSETKKYCYGGEDNMKLFTISAVIACTFPVAVWAQDVTLKMGHGASSKHIFHAGLESFAAKVAEKTDGSVTIEVFGDRLLGDDKQLLEGLQIGLIDGALVSTATLPLVLNATAFDALQLPFVADSYQSVSDVLTSELGAELLATLDDSSIKGVGFVEAGLRHFLTSGDAVGMTSGFSGLKTRIVPIPLHKAVWEAIGVNPIGMAYGEIYSALETGTIDAVEINVSSIESESLYDAGKNLTLTGHYFWPGAVMLSAATWDRLNDAQKEAVEEAGRETTIEAYQRSANQESDTIKSLEGHGVTVTNLGDLDVMQGATSAVVQDWSKKDPLIGKIVDALKAGN
jgi:tripartite ATP-independent transporter DctP family solute receptor